MNYLTVCPAIYSYYQCVSFLKQKGYVQIFDIIYVCNTPRIAVFHYCKSSREEDGDGCNK